MIVAGLLLLKYSCHCRVVAKHVVVDPKAKFVTLLLVAKALLRCHVVVVAKRKNCCMPSSDKNNQPQLRQATWTSFKHLTHEPHTEQPRASH